MFSSRSSLTGGSNAFAGISHRRLSQPLDGFTDIFLDDHDQHKDDDDDNDSANDDHDQDSFVVNHRETQALLTRRTSSTAVPPVSAALLRFAAASKDPLATPSQPSSSSSPPPLCGSYLLYTSVLITVLCGPQLGWEIAQLNLGIFHNDKDCARRPIIDGTCIMFPGHTRLEWILAVMCWVIGAALGALFCNVPADKYGRRVVVMGNAMLMVVGALVQTLAPTIEVFALGRFVSGLASGSGTAITSVYLGEIGPAHQRAAFVVAFQFMGSVGLLSITLVHFAITGSPTSWRWIMGFPIVLGSLQLLLSPCWLIESPKWLLVQQRDREAATAFHALYHRGSFQELQGIVKTDQDKTRRRRQSLLAVTTSTSSSSSSSSAGAGNNHATPAVVTSFWTDALSPRYKRQFLISCILCIARQFGGVSAVFYYSSGIFSGAGIADPRVGNVLLATCNLISVLLVCLFMKRLPRRTALLTGITGMILCSIGMTLTLVYQHPLSVAFTAVYVACNSFSLSPLPFLVTAEVLPEHLKSKGVSVTSFINWLCNLVVGFGFPVLAHHTGNFTFVPFTVLLVIFWTCVFVWLPETKNKTNEQIQHAFAQSTGTSLIASLQKHKELDSDNGHLSSSSRHEAQDLELGVHAPTTTSGSAVRRPSRRTSVEFVLPTPTHTGQPANFSQSA